MLKYYDLGADKRLNEIVMVGTHDAGITRGGGHVMTQKLDILGQASAGARIFDLRVAGAAKGRKQVALKTYHGAPSKSRVSKRVVGLQGKQDVVESIMKTGTWGESLQAILADARGFVTAWPTEFLILKFDKCKNWEQIALLCVQELGGTLYTGSGNVNKKTLFDLKGKVVVVFTSDGLTAVGGSQPQLLGTGGILGITSLAGGGTYRKDYNGIQYFGKGGTDLTTRKGKSIKENYDKQLALMRQGAAGDPNVLGMMYWTTTGVLGNIKQRNKIMWQTPHRQQLVQLWQNGMGDALKQRIPPNVDPTSYGGGPILKRFLPNIVMIDFASLDKCQTIYDLNTIIPTQMTLMEQLMVALQKLA